MIVGPFLLAAALACLGPAAGQEFQSKAAEALLVDDETGTVLFSKDPDRLFPPAALTKLMTMEVVFHALKTGERHLSDTFVVSENAWRIGGAPSGGSTMFARSGSTISLENLIQGAIVQSANDACIVIAEGFAGSEAKFAMMMNERAKEIGLRRSVFVNSTGLPADGQVVTARDLVMLARHIRTQYPDLYKYFGQPEFTWNKITQRNRNPLLAIGIGADGMGTGYTDASGFSIVGSAGMAGRRLVAVLGGLATDRERASEAKAMLEWGQQTFRKVEIFGKASRIGDAVVFGGDRPTVSVKVDKSVEILLPKEVSGRVSARIRYDGPIVAPVGEGMEIGTVQVFVADHMSLETSVYAGEAVGRGTLPQRAIDALQELLTGWRRKPSS